MFKLKKEGDLLPKKTLVSLHGLSSLSSMGNLKGIDPKHFSDPPFNNLNHCGMSLSLNVYCPKP